MTFDDAFRARLRDPAVAGSHRGEIAKGDRFAAEQVGQAAQPARRGIDDPRESCAV